MSSSDELLRKILKHPDLVEVIKDSNDLDSLTISEAKRSEDPYVAATGEILFQLSQNKNASATSVYTSVQQLLKKKL